MKYFLLILAFFPFLAVRAQTCGSATWYYVEGLKALHVRGDAAAAAASFEQALALDPDHAGALVAAAATMPSKALEYSRRAWLSDTTDVHLRRQLTRLLLNKNLIAEAAAIAPDDIEVMLAQADRYRSQGDDTRFLDVVKRLMQRDEIDVAALFEDIIRDRAFYARNYMRLLDMAGMMMLSDPADYRIVDLYAGALIAGGQAERGIEVYKNYITDTTSFVAPYNMVIDGEVYLRRADSVRLWSDRARARFPDDVTLHLHRGGALARVGYDKEALASYREVRRRANADSLRSVAHALTGVLYATRDKARRSIVHYRRAIKLDPANALALNNLAYTLATQGRGLNKALAMSGKTLETEPQNATYIDTYGYILYRLGRLDQAKKTLRQAMSLLDDPEIMEHYADVLQALGEEFMSQYYRKKAEGLKK